ncbi:dihydrodipicolinate synthase family protein [Elioraea sp.]|uniref:dihydrodipicolinate synthase family protein n=1 Tax=Elioraea sp. TaxID=2185103 RepID=UPI0025BB2509|nr:dihydrodipicolinate synthase family protein [Elioraea sp.]
MIPAHANPWDGIYPSTIVPMTDEGVLDEAAIARHTADVAASDGIVGVLCNGHAGENVYLTRAEKRRVIELTVSTVGQRRIIVCGINAEATDEAILHAEDARDAGADALMVFAPNGWATFHDPAAIMAHHEAVIGAAGLPVFLFQGSVNAGRTAFPPSLLAALARLPGVVGVKEGSWETAAYEASRRAVAEAAPHVRMMASGDEHLFTCYVLGSEGSLVSLADIIPETIVALDRAVRASDLVAARRHHAIIYPLARAIYGTAPGGWATARIKACLALLGRIPSATTKRPIGPLPGAEVERLREVLVATGLLRA